VLTHPNISLPIIGIYLTHKCNLQCRHCFWATDKTFSRELTFEEWKYVLGKFIKIGTRHFHICGREPTLSEKLLNILAFLKNLKVTCYPELKYGIITNGASLDENYAFALANLGLDYIEISLDGGEA
jgi:MoaA/NifB/PqqE/SkfB family radical SAM enzyme